MRSLATTPRRAFTLVELLVVLAILSIVAGILFPVFVSVKRAALQSQCLANFSKAGKATILYTTDYDDRLVPTNHRPGMPPDPVLDRTWPQLLLPYVRDFRTFTCPMDRQTMDFGGPFDPDLLPGDYAARYYNASLHSDLGYNAYYLSPTLYVGNGWITNPRMTTEAPPETLLFIESGDGQSGSYIVSPPCRYVAAARGWVDTFISTGQPSSQSGPLPGYGDIVYAPVKGWTLQGDESSLPFGGVWRRHGERLNVVRLDGSARSVTLGDISQGCDVQPTWRGAITDTSVYAWYPRG